MFTNDSRPPAGHVESLGSYALILFDLDGTLIDSAPDLTLALGLALADVGLPAHDEPAVRRMVGDGQRTLIERALLAAGGELTQTDETLACFRHHYTEHLCERTQVYPQVRETLAALPAVIPQAVATNKPGRWARQLCTQLQLGPSLRWVLGEDDVGARKPDPKLLLHLCELAGVAPARTLMVGDSRIDVEAARAAGVAVALCTYGYGDAELYAAARARQADLALPLGCADRPFLIEQFAQLLTLGS